MWNVERKLWWLWIPVFFMIFQVVIEFTLPVHELTRMHSEAGLHESLQTLVLFLAIVVAGRLLWVMDGKAQKWFAGWIGLAFVCLIYVFLEENSYGQHVFNWNTPEYWARINDQQETNLHNTSSWLDQKPRLILEIGVITGGLLIPLARRYRPSLLPDRFTAIYPSSLLVVTALLAVFPKLIEKIAEAADIRVFERVSEVQELYFYYFVLLYLIMLRRNIKTA